MNSTITIARYRDQYVRLVRTQKAVVFSTEPDWILIEYDLDRAPERRPNRRWVRATTRFDWVRQYLAA